MNSERAQTEILGQRIGSTRFLSLTIGVGTMLKQPLGSHDLGIILAVGKSTCRRHAENGYALTILMVDVCATFE